MVYLLYPPIRAWHVAILSAQGADGHAFSTAFPRPNPSRLSAHCRRTPPPTDSRSVHRSPRLTEPRLESKGSLPSTTAAAPDAPPHVVPKEPNGDGRARNGHASQRAAGSGVAAEVLRFPQEGDGPAALAVQLLHFEKRLSAMSELLTESRSSGPLAAGTLGAKGTAARVFPFSARPRPHSGRRARLWGRTTGQRLYICYPKKFVYIISFGPGADTDPLSGCIVTGVAAARTRGECFRGLRFCKLRSSRLEFPRVCLFQFVSRPSTEACSTGTCS